MFTGIVTHQGIVRAIGPLDSDGASHVIRITVDVDQPLPGVRIGDSIAVAGTCLTVVAFAEECVSFDVVPETLRKTTLSQRATGDRVNLERALKLGDELGGHWVQGHVDGIATLEERTAREGDERLVFSQSAERNRGLLPKGSVTLDGVSLTVGEVWSVDADVGRFCVYLIPHTLAATTLGGLRIGESVNVELDILGRWVGHHVAQMSSAL